ncbi:uncharacterized oxidoreductase YjmC isoform X1 [Drosophila santomea]|uniref:uncharacterized oxidoreductase YjmC isoform X1 n=2 Tax=Drosophila santomea TaxID=129105 RepID=UPI001953E3A3|nr:uncharacterized oxidoreductase YjmC isoform X1 [Drosophila santomea]
MRVVVNFLDALRKVSLKLSTEKLVPSSKTPNNLAAHKLNKGVKATGNERRCINESTMRIDHTEEVPKNITAGSDMLWHNIKRVLLMCGGQKQPGGSEDAKRIKDSSALVDVLEAQRFVSQVFSAMQVPKQAASEMADALIAADYMGQRSMGIHRLPSIAADLLNCTVAGNATPGVVSEKKAIALVDGHNAPGPVVANFCMDLALQKAREVGIGWVSARSSNCIGFASWYACQALEQRMIGLCMTNGAPTLVPAGGIEPILGENPIACAASGVHEKFLADFGMAACSVDELELSYCNGWSNEVPKLVAFDRNGKETTSTEEALRAQRIRAFQPEHKGFGMAAAVDILCGVMTGARYANQIQRRGVYSTENAPANLGQVYVAIDPMRFCPSFEDRLADFHRLLRLAMPSQVGKPAMVPGDKELQHMKLVDEQGGLTMTPCTLSVLEELATQLDIEPLKMTAN